jgi:hypothetical protein
MAQEWRRQKAGGAAAQRAAARWSNGARRLVRPLGCALGAGFDTRRNADCGKKQANTKQTNKLELEEGLRSARTDVDKK